MDDKVDSRKLDAQGLLFCDLNVLPQVLPYQWEFDEGRLEALVDEIEDLHCPCCRKVLRGRGVRRRVLAAALSRAVIRLERVSVIRNLGTPRQVETDLYLPELPADSPYLDEEGRIVGPRRRGEV